MKREHNYKSFKFSIPEIFVYPIDVCRTDDGMRTIELIHYSDARDEDEKIVRSNQKFKLLDITIFYMD